jgi:FkbM family methyltransferase
MTDRSPRFYSQNGEDYLLWEFFAGKKDGFYVDIGAFDGMHLSNTLTFELMGWQGVCVEPNPEMFELCRRNRTHAVCLNEACLGSTESGKVSFFVDEMGLLSSVFKNEEKLHDIKERYRKRGLVFSHPKEIEVNTCTLNEILVRYAPNKHTVDFVSIDTEGSELDIVRGIDFQNYDIRVLVIEFDKTSQSELADVLRKKGGYLLSRKTLHNLVFVKNREDWERMNAIPINCVIERQLHPKGIRFTPLLFQKGKVIKDGRICTQRR